MSGARYGAGRSALLIAEAPARAEAERALAAIDARVVAIVGFDEANERLALQAGVDLLVIETAGVDDDTLEPVLARAAELATVVTTIVTCTPAQLDQVAGVLLEGATLLCDPRPSDRVAALALAGRDDSSRVREDGDEAGTRLLRLSEEVARIAEAMAALSREERPAGLTTQPAIPAPSSAPVSVAPVRGAIRARRLRDQYFADALFADPAWDMLLDLFAAELEEARVSVSSLCIAAAVPSTTALRWIATMTAAGLLKRVPDPADRRRAYLALTPAASQAMRGYWGAVQRAGLMPV